MAKYLSDAQVAARYSVSRQTVWRWVKGGILPEPVSFSPGCTRWNAEELDKRDAERERRTAAA